MHVFLAASDVDAVRRDMDAGLPEQFRGWPVRFGWNGVPTQHHVRVAHSPTGCTTTSASTHAPA